MGELLKYSRGKVSLEIEDDSDDGEYDNNLDNEEYDNNLDNEEDRNNLDNEDKEIELNKNFRYSKLREILLSKPLIQSSSEISTPHQEILPTPKELLIFS